MGAFGEDLVLFNEKDIDRTLTFERIQKMLFDDLNKQKLALPDRQSYEDECEWQYELRTALDKWMSAQGTISPCHIVGTTPELMMRDCNPHIDEAFENTIANLSAHILLDALTYEANLWLEKNRS